MGIDEVELKPCPFCGASAYIEQGKSEPCQMHGDRSATFRVVAMHTDSKFSNESNAKRRECHVRPTITRSSREDVIEAWNTRAQQPTDYTLAMEGALSALIPYGLLGAGKCTIGKQHSDAARAAIASLTKALGR